MDQPAFFYRFRHGYLRRWEQMLVGAVAGYVVGFFLCCFMDLSSPKPRPPGQLSILEGTLLIGSILAFAGGLACALAEVRQMPMKSREESTVDTWKHREDYIVAEIYAKEHATPEDLLALGKELEAWRSNQPAVTAIGGLEELLSSHYPPPDGPTPYVTDSESEDMMPFGRLTPEGFRADFFRARIVDPWIYCPALVWAMAELTSKEAIESLRQTIPSALISAVTPSFPKN